MSVEREYLRGRVSAFNDMAALIERDSFDFGLALADEQKAELRRVLAMFYRNGACMEMVAGGVTSWDDLRARQSSEWPTSIADLGADPDPDRLPVFGTKL